MFQPFPDDRSYPGDVERFLSQILAELDFAPSGISRFEHDVRLPFATGSASESQQNEYQFSLLAQISLRRLLNRVHANLYNQGNSILE